MQSATRLSLALAFLLLLSLSYIGYDKWQQSQTQKLVAAYQAGQQDGLAGAVVALFQQTENCNAAAVRNENATRTLVNLECVKTAQAQQKK